MRATPTGLTITHLAGPEPLTVTYDALDGSERSAVVDVGAMAHW